MAAPHQYSASLQGAGVEHASEFCLLGERRGKALKEVKEPAVVLKVSPRRSVALGLAASAAAVAAVCMVAGINESSVHPVVSSMFLESAAGLTSLAGRRAEEDGQVRYTYGLNEAPCPVEEGERSAGAKVTLKAIKDMIGAAEEEDVDFWWVYPKAKISNASESMSIPSDRMEFEHYGGYVYSWGRVGSKMSIKKCLALNPMGEGSQRLTLSPTVEFPKSTKVEWHKSVGAHEASLPLFAWIPPAAQDSVCEHGCFVYKAAEDGQTLTLKVVGSGDSEERARKGGISKQ